MHRQVSAHAVTRTVVVVQAEAPQRCPRPLSTAGPLGMTPDGGGDAGSSSVPLSTKDAAVGESVIRLMTRLSMQHGAVNLRGLP